MNVTALVAAIDGTPKAPCDTCPQARDCARLRLACQDFKRYLESRRPLGGERVPDRMTYRDLYAVRCHAIGCKARTQPDKTAGWGFTRIPLRGWVDACPAHARTQSLSEIVQVA